MRLRFQILATVFIGIALPHLVASFGIRHRREVPDAPENYKYYVRPFVVPEPETMQRDALLKAQSVSESTSVKQYKPPLLTGLPMSNQPTGSYQPPLPLLSSIPRYQEPSRQSPPLARKPPLYPASDITELSQSPPERRSGAIDNRSKAVGSSHHPSQAIHQVPASEIQSNKGALAKDRDSAKNDEYVVYYYYYYDNDTNSNNLTLNFDDIPSLDSYDDAKSGKEPEKSASSRSIAANVNALTSSAQDQPKESAQRTASTPKANASSAGASQPRSISSSDTASEPVIRADKPDNTLDDAVIQPLKPVSNVFRYGSNEVPRFPVLPNFIVSEVPKEVKSEAPSTLDTLSTPPSTTLPTFTTGGVSADERLRPEVDSDDANNVLDSDTKAVEEHEEKASPESSTTTTTTTTTELPTTTEIQTTTTEKSRRRPGVPVGGGRTRFRGSSPAPSRSRQIPTRSSAATPSTTSTTRSTSSTTRSTFRGTTSNRLRPRQPIGGNRPRTSPSSSKPEDNEDSGSSKPVESTVTTSSRSRLSTTAAPRRFAGSRSSPSRPASASTFSTTPSSRARTTSRPRPSLITKNRPRPGFLKPRSGKEEEPEVVETTTPEPEVTEEKTPNSPSPSEVTEPEDQEESESPDTETPEAEGEETEEPTTTEKNRFAALFRPRNRSSGGNRPRPVIANRPSRSRR